PGLVVYAQYVNVLDAFGEFYSDHPFRLRRLIQDIFTGTVPDGPDQVVLDGRTAFLISSLQCHLYLFWLCGGLLFSLVGRWCLADGAQRITELLGVASQKKLATRMAGQALQLRFGISGLSFGESEANRVHGQVDAQFLNFSCGLTRIGVTGLLTV